MKWRSFHMCNFDGQHALQLPRINPR
jgi:hypothetical protein